MENHWSEEEAKGLSDLELLVYQSRLIGADPALVLWGGGNTSLKVTQRDFRGRSTKCMLIKGSGSDMRSAQAGDFPAVRLDDVLPLFIRSDMADEAVVNYLERCPLDPGSPRPSIETLLHAFLPQASIVHTHADAILSLTNTREPQEALRGAFGTDVVWMPYRRPGFLPSKETALAALKRPGTRGVVMLNHGLVTWGPTPKASYDAHIELVSRAEEFIRQMASGKLVFGGTKVSPIPREERQRVAAAVAPVLRGYLTPPGGPRLLLRFDDSDDILAWAGSRGVRELAEAGAATPDHILNTKRAPLLVEVSDPSYAGELRRALTEGVARYRESYAEWYVRYSPDPVDMLDPNPRVIL
ncbi:MAG: class II aldolase/adducin family protein, partial [Chloroflexota bacterium]